MEVGVLRAVHFGAVNFSGVLHVLIRGPAHDCSFFHKFSIDLRPDIDLCQHSLRHRFRGHLGNVICTLLYFLSLLRGRRFSDSGPAVKWELVLRNDKVVDVMSFYFHWLSAQLFKRLQITLLDAVFQSLNLGPPQLLPLLLRLVQMGGVIWEGGSKCFIDLKDVNVVVTGVETAFPVARSQCGLPGHCLHFRKGQPRGLAKVAVQIEGVGA